MGEVALHCTADDAWVVLRGRVYNMTPYLRFHPGGAAVLMEVAGKDGTALFDKWHSWVNAGVSGRAAGCWVGGGGPLQGLSTGIVIC